jgi:hypothetical protein
VVGMIHGNHFVPEDRQGHSVLPLDSEARGVEGG